MGNQVPQIDRTLEPKKQEENMFRNYPYIPYPDLQPGFGFGFGNTQRDDFRQVSNTSRNDNRHHNSNCKFNRENFNIENEKICGSDSCKKLILNELNAKYLERIKSSSEKIRLLKNRIDFINKTEIPRLNDRIYENSIIVARNYTSWSKELADAELRDLQNGITNFRNEIVSIEAELKYLTSYDIEFKQFRDEIMPIPTTPPPTTATTTTPLPDAPSFPKDCKSLRSDYEILPSITFGSAPRNVQNWWSNNCGNEITTCKELRNKYGIIPGQTFGSAPQNVQNWWYNNCGNERAT
jgi:hypothetical protein